MNLPSRQSSRSDEVLANLNLLGFDLSEVSDDGETPLQFRVRCSCCEALVIQGTPCHERGCSNKPHECRECGCLIPAGESCDCMDQFDDEQPEFDDDREAGDENYPACEDEFAGSQSC